jgi:ArsR family transcriptional regulator
MQPEPMKARRQDGFASIIPFIWNNQTMEEQHIIRSLTALAQTHRLKVFRLLVVAGQQGLTPGALADALGIPTASLSFHLKEMTHAGLVTQERVSRNVVYRAAFDHMEALLAYLTENCCQGAVCLPASAQAAPAVPRVARPADDGALGLA